MYFTVVLYAPNDKIKKKKYLVLHLFAVVVSSLSCFQLFVTPWTVACQAPLSVGFYRPEYWSGLPFPPPGDLPNPGIEPWSPALAGGFFTTELLGKPLHSWMNLLIFIEV